MADSVVVVFCFFSFPFSDEKDVGVAPNVVRGGVGEDCGGFLIFGLVIGPEWCSLSRRATRAGLEDVARRAKLLIGASRATSTWTAYSRYVEDFVAWATDSDVPLDAQSFVLFLADRSSKVRGPAWFLRRITIYVCFSVVGGHHGGCSVSGQYVDSRRSTR